MPYFKSWEEIEDCEDGPTVAEKKLKAALEGGWICVLGPKDKIPPEPQDWSALPSNREIRADVLRFVMTNETDTEIAPQCLKVIGAYVSGHLKLDNAEIVRSIAIVGCRFQKGINASHSKWKYSVELSHSGLPHFIMPSASINGHLNLDKSIFRPSQPTPAINLQGTKIDARVNLTSAKVYGPMTFIHTKIGGQLDLTNATISGSDLPAISLVSAEVGGEFFFEGVNVLAGQINLTSATVVTLKDDSNSWLGSEELVLDGFTYQRLHGKVDIVSRIAWLEKGSSFQGQFFPQPYKQLAKVLHEIGHEADGREVLYTLEVKLGRERRKRLKKDIAELSQTAPLAGSSIAKRLLLCMDYTADWLQRITVGYGRKPFRSLSVLLGLLAAFWLATIGAWHSGDFAPNSAVILQSEEWRDLDPETHANAAQHWADNSPTGRDWESFHSLAYAADVVIPIVEFGQTDAWAPSTERGFWGYHLWWLRWVFTTLGWIVTALGAAALTGIIRRE